MSTPTAPEQQPMIPRGYELKKKKPIYKRIWFILLVLIVLIVIIVSVSSSGGSSSGGGASDTVHVTYTLESDSPTVSATYMTLDNGNIGQSQDNQATPPWTKELDVSDSFVQSFTLTGQMNPVALSGGEGQDGTTITCRITVDGEVVAEQTSTGQYAIVTCNAN
jgi:hypothetical protein